MLTIEAVDAFVTNREFVTDDVLAAIGASRASLDLSDPAVVRTLAQRFGLSEDAFVRACMAFVTAPPAVVAAEAVKIPDVANVLPAATSQHAEDFAVRARERVAESREANRRERESTD